MGHLTQDVVEGVPVPVPDGKVQARIAGEVARRLRAEARTIWDDAKRRFEEELLGPETAAEGPRVDGSKGGHNQ